MDLATVTEVAADPPEQGRSVAEGGRRLPVVALIVLIAIAAGGSCLYIYRILCVGYPNLPPIRSDGYGYYAYLPSIVLHHSLSFPTASHYAAQSASLLRAYGIGLDVHTGHMVDKYPIGASLLQLPFFLVATAYATISYHLVTGYSGVFQAASVVSGIFYLCVGASFAYLCARRFSSQWIALLATALIVFSTNVFDLGTFDSSYSQIYSFAVISAYLYLCLRLRDGRGSSRRRVLLLLVTGLLLGLAFSVRNLDVIVGVIALTVVLRRRPWHENLKEVLLVGAGALVGALPQLAYVTYATGSPFTNTYGGVNGGKVEGFVHLTDPALVSFLFSTTNGLFLLTPVTLLAIVSFWPLARRDRKLALSMLSVLVVDIYLFASWWTWSFGGKLHMPERPMVDVMGLLVVPLAVGIAALRTKFSERPQLVVASVLVLSAVALTSTMLLTYHFWHEVA